MTRISALALTPPKMAPMVTRPGRLAVTRPAVFTDATEVSELLHALTVAGSAVPRASSTVAVRRSVSPTRSVSAETAKRISAARSGIVGSLSRQAARTVQRARTTLLQRIGMVLLEETLQGQGRPT